jgi:hypothetical protein
MAWACTAFPTNDMSRTALAQALAWELLTDPKRTFQSYLLERASLVGLSDDLSAGAQIAAKATVNPNCDLHSF